MKKLPWWRLGRVDVGYTVEEQDEVLTALEGSTSEVTDLSHRQQEDRIDDTGQSE